MSFRNQGQNQSKFRPGEVKKAILRPKKETKWFKKPGKPLQTVVHRNLRWSKNCSVKSVVRVNYVEWHGGKEIAAIHHTTVSSIKQQWSNPNTPKLWEWRARKLWSENKDSAERSRAGVKIRWLVRTSTLLELTDWD